MRRRLTSFAVATTLSLVALGTVLTQSAQAFPVDTQAQVQQELAYVVNDVANYWQSELSKEGYAWHSVRYDIFPGSQTFESACGTVSADDAVGSPASYCPADNTIYLSVQWIYNNIAQPHYDAAGQFYAGGDFGPAVAVAHEMGHALQRQLGITNIPGYPNVQPTELQADCFAGRWAQEKYTSAQLEAGDIDEGVAALRAVGDYDFNAASHHGTPAERQRAFLSGLQGSGISSCPLNVGA
jgi:uncharacterized protein